MGIRVFRRAASLEALRKNIGWRRPFPDPQISARLGACPVTPTLHSSPMPPGSEPTGAVFLSYSHEDKAAVARIADGLRAAGVEVWFDQSELRGGDAWDAKIRRQIKECTLFVAIISAHTEERPKGYFRREWKLAVDCTHDLADDVPFLVPVAIDGTSEATARVPEKFCDYQWSRLPGGQPTPAFIEHVRHLLGARAENPAGALPTPVQTATNADQSDPSRTAFPTVHAEARPPAFRPARFAPRRDANRAKAWISRVAAALALIAAGIWAGRSYFPATTREHASATWLELGPPHGRFGTAPAPSV
jgi:hypothetical protein